MAQDRSFLTNTIGNDWGRCRTVAISRSKGDVAICDECTYALNSAPSSLGKLIKDEIYVNSIYITDIQIDEKGGWVVLYGDNEIRWDNISASLEKTLNDFKAAGDVISLVTFNSRGEWIVVSNNQISASHNHLAELLTKGMDECGELITACVSEDCTVLIFEGGIRSSGNPPASLMEALEATDLVVTYLKISYDHWFIAGKGGYQYYM